METILDWLDWPGLIVAILAPFIGRLIQKVCAFIKEMITGRESAPMRPNKPPKENQLGDCKAVQCIAKRNLLILQARQDAKKRPRISVEFYCLITLLYVSMFIYYLLSPLIKEATETSYPFMLFYIVYLFVLMALTFFVFPLFLSNVPTWIDLIKRRQDKYSIHKSRQEAIKEAIKKDAIKKAKKVGKKAIKEAEKRRRLHISQVIDVASHFDTYLLLDADSRETFLKDGVIGAKGINEDEPIRKVIESYLSESDTNGPKQAQGDACKSAQTDKDTAVIFIYSRHGKASYERTKEAWGTQSMYKYIYDLGPVCGDMRELEIVAHQLLYLQDGKCLRLP